MYAIYPLMFIEGSASAHMRRLSLYDEPSSAMFVL